MSDPSDRRALGDYQTLLDPFNQSLEQGKAEIPQNIERSRRSIMRILNASQRGHKTVAALREERQEIVLQAKQDFRDIRRVLIIGRLFYGRVYLKVLAVKWFFYLRLFLLRYRHALLGIVAFVLLVWFVTTYVPILWSLALDWFSPLPDANKAREFTTGFVWPALQSLMEGPA
ncbi:hypothetical protein [uncultured Cohaesibacter sp.]|uniref:hypothetical protein n=1 Tax=uncultured Cohaesibacter sp. TaxID=1002546 RepID=UPI0029306A7A|nr:hypothetical protein [uncultured Cohaesibacter sp.]